MGAGSLLQLAVAGRGAQAYTVESSSRTDRGIWEPPSDNSRERHQAFSIESYELQFETSPSLTHINGGKYRVFIPRHGDLLQKATLTFKLPPIYSTDQYQFRWCRYPALAFIERIDLYVDNTIIDTVYPEFEVIYRDGSYRYPNRVDVYEDLVGDIFETTDPVLQTPIVTVVNNVSTYINYRVYTVVGEESIKERRVYVPISMFFSKGTKNALPLLNMQYSQAYFDVTFRPLRETYRVLRPSNPSLGHLAPEGSDDRIESFVYPSGNSNGDVSIPLEASVFATYVFLENRDRIERSLKSRLDYVSEFMRYETVLGIEGNTTVTLTQFAYTTKTLFWFFTRSDRYSRNNFGDFSKEGDGGGLGELDEPMKRCGLLLRGMLREEDKPAYFYRSIQSYYNSFTGSLPVGVYMYSFSTLTDGSNKEAGSISLGSTGKLQFRLEMNMPSEQGVSYDMHVYGLTTNVFRVSSGQAGLVFV